MMPSAAFPRLGVWWWYYSLVLLGDLPGGALSFVFVSPPPPIGGTGTGGHRRRPCQALPPSPKEATIGRTVAAAFHFSSDDHCRLRRCCCEPPPGRGMGVRRRAGPSRSALPAAAVSATTTGGAYDERQTRNDAWIAPREDAADPDLPLRRHLHHHVDEAVRILRAIDDDVLAATTTTATTAAAGEETGSTTTTMQQQRKDDIMELMSKRHQAEFDAAWASSLAVEKGREEQEEAAAAANNHDGGGGAQRKRTGPSYEWIVVVEEDATAGVAPATTTMGEGSSASTAAAAPTTTTPVRPSSSSSSSSFGYRLAVQSVGVPILNSTAVDVIRTAAEAHWEERKGGRREGRRTSRFTYQRPGNYEAHLSDLATPSSTAVLEVINEALLDKIYPLIRQSLWNDDEDGRTTPATYGGADNDGRHPSPVSDRREKSRLYVYDALVIRYNATEAAMAAAEAEAGSVHPGRGADGSPVAGLSGGAAAPAAAAGATGAGQPYHRDYGIVSVNIMLNDPNEFVGGGTFFENQFRGGTDHGGPPPAPLKPKEGVGHCLAHYSSERHAGSATVRGVRDVLVIFVTAAAFASTSVAAGPPGRGLADGATSSGVVTPPPLSPPLPPVPIQSAYLKHQAREATAASGGSCDDDRHLSRVLHHRMAAGASPLYDDGEAWLYLGTALMEYSDFLALPDAERHRAGLQDDDRDDDGGGGGGRGGTGDYEKALLASKRCLDLASGLIPCDSRVFNSLALVHKRLVANEATEEGSGDGAGPPTCPPPSSRWTAGEAEHYHRRACEILERSDRAGVDVAAEHDSSRLNYGLHLANQDRFRDACRILEPVARKTTAAASAADPAVVRDAHKLWAFCSRRQEQSLQHPPR